MKIADLILVRGTAGLSREIEFISNSLYSHVAGVTYDGTSEGRLIEAQAFQKTDYRDINAYAGASDVFTCDIATIEQRIAIERFVEARVGTEYSYLLIGWELIHYVFHLDIPFEERKRFICSTLWVQAYRSVGIDLCPGKKFPSPGDVGLSLLLRKYTNSVLPKIVFM